MPVQSLKDLIVLAKAKPRSLNYGSTGIGSTANMAGALLNSMAGIQLVHVPYNATGTESHRCDGGAFAPGHSQHRARVIRESGLKAELAR